ncbi:MAG: DUF1844 domain-containing protein [Tepidisphaeraceae bacterium]|jgi:hypothetical protein
MSEEKPSLHVDTDWKRQAQEEKRRLAEEEARKAKESIGTSGASAASLGVGPAAPSAAAPAGAGATAAATAGRRGRGEGVPPASFAVLVQSLLTQILFYLGDLTARGNEPQINLDMAKHQIDILGILEEKTRGNLSDDEKKLLDTALYETRMRYVSVASQFT